MFNYHQSFEEMRISFLTKGICIDKPGFYDEPNFLKIEKDYPEFLNCYASYVQSQPYSDEYLKNAKENIPLIVNALNNELIQDGRQGACIDISSLLSKILEHEGYWNYIVKGSLTISFPESSKIKPTYYWSFDTGRFEAGHAWVFAPPYKVIDISIKQQKQPENELEYIPNFVLAENVSPCNMTVMDII